MYSEAKHSIIKAHERSGYEPVEAYPRNIVFGHSTRWPKLIQSMEGKLEGLKVGKHTTGHFEDELDFDFNETPMKYVLASEGSLGLQTQIIKHAMRGGQNFVNIGCVGGINPRLGVGSQVICKEAIRHSGFGQHLATPDERAITSETLNKILSEITEASIGMAVMANVWCVDTLYYTFDQLQQALNGCLSPDVVEMEMEAGTITTGWLNANYFPEKPKQYAQLGYVSDQLPLKESEWTDPFKGNKTKIMIPWKKQAFEIAIKALSAAHTKN
jgi:hypothetical protein